MIKPTPDEVSRYAYKIGFILDGHDFCNYYESKGWMVGKSPMKVWQAAVRLWKSKAVRSDHFGTPKTARISPLISEEEKNLSDQERLEMREKIESAKKIALKKAQLKSQELMERQWDIRESVRRAEGR